MSQFRSRQMRSRASSPSSSGRFWRLRSLSGMWKKPDHPEDALLIRSSLSDQDLRNAIEYHTDWTPFDLVETSPRKTRAGQLKSSICVFRYVGPAKEHRIFRSDLHRVLRRIAPVRALPRKAIMERS